MQVLVLYDAQIKAWLVGEPIDTVADHITNGYPELLDAWQSETLKADVIEVPDEDAFRCDLYEANDGQIKRKEGV